MDFSDVAACHTVKRLLLMKNPSPAQLPFYLTRALQYFGSSVQPRVIRFGILGRYIWPVEKPDGPSRRPMSSQGLGMNASRAIKRLCQMGFVKFCYSEHREGLGVYEWYRLTDEGLAFISSGQDKGNK